MNKKRKKVYEKYQSMIYLPCNIVSDFNIEIFCYKKSHHELAKATSYSKKKDELNKNEGSFLFSISGADKLGEEIYSLKLSVYI